MSHGFNKRQNCEKAERKRAFEPVNPNEPSPTWVALAFGSNDWVWVQILGINLTLNWLWFKTTQTKLPQKVFIIASLES